MKFSVYFKTLTAFAVLALLFIFAFFKYLNSVERTIVDNAQKTISMGLLSSLTDELSRTPRSDWDEVMKPYNAFDMEIVSLDKTTFSPNQQKRLNRGKIVFKTGEAYQFLNLVIAKHTAYKKIEKHPKVIAYYFNMPKKIVSHYMMPVLNQITHDLEKQPKQQWKAVLARSEKTYGYPIQFFSVESPLLPKTVQQTISHQTFQFQTKENTSQIAIIYYAYRGGVIKIGPLHYLSITARISDVISYFVVAFFICSFCLVLFFSLLFVKNMKKIYQMTEYFSHGNFTYECDVGATSVLHGLYINIQNMGKRIKELIESHKQMCRFVAHEMRTPLSTIQMATDRIQMTQTDLPAIAKQVKSIQEDIGDMNHIVSTFLMYSRVHSTELNLNKSDIEIIAWIEKILAPYQSSTLDIRFINPSFDQVMVRGDETLLKYAITNLITNAMKFARNQIHITVSGDGPHLAIGVDDDGPGLPGEVGEDIFSEYRTFASDVNEDKHIGLGLAIVKKIIERHGGNVIATTSPTLKGARFSIILPR